MQDIEGRFTVKASDLSKATTVNHSVVLAVTITLVFYLL